VTELKSEVSTEAEMFEELLLDAMDTSAMSFEIEDSWNEY